MNTSTSIGSLPDIKMSLRCAMAVAHLERFPPPQNHEVAHRIISTITHIPSNLTLLGFTAAFKLMVEISGHEKVAVSCAHNLEMLATGLRMWVGGRARERSGLEKNIKMGLVERCLRVRKWVATEMDAGYTSMSEENL